MQTQQDEIDDRDELAARAAEALDGRSVATAESCTAGRVAGAFAAVPHATEFFRGGLVAYQTPVKRSLLGLTEPSPLSLESAKQMARGACQLLDADVGIATTGVLGPRPEEGIEAGTVFIATCIDGRLHAREHHVGGEPEEMCHEAMLHALRDAIADLTAEPTEPATWEVEREAPVRADAEGLFITAADAPHASIGDRIVIRGRSAGTERSGTVADLCERDGEPFLRVDLDA